MCKVITEIKEYFIENYFFEENYIDLTRDTLAEVLTSVKNNEEIAASYSQEILDDIENKLGAIEKAFIDFYYNISITKEDIAVIVYRGKEEPVFIYYVGHLEQSPKMNLVEGYKADFSTMMAGIAMLKNFEKELKRDA